MIIRTDWPLELVDLVVAELFELCGNVERSPGRSTKPLWSVVEGLANASKTYRSIFLAHWLPVLFIRHPLGLGECTNLSQQTRRANIQ